MKSSAELAVVCADEDSVLALPVTNASVVLNKLFKMTALQTSFGVNNIALVHMNGNVYWNAEKPR